MDEAAENTSAQRGQWFVVQALSGHENKVRETLERKMKSGNQAPVYEARIPMVTEIEIRNGKKVKINRKIFPGYVLVRMDLYNAEGEMDENAWFFVRNVQGVLGFLGGRNQRDPEKVLPQPLTEQEVRDMLPRDDQDGMQPQMVASVKVGDIVRIKEGAFMGYEGNVSSVDETRCRLTVVIEVFGRSTPVVDLEFWQVEPAV